MKGHIQKRGENAWRLKFDLGRHPGTGERLTRFVTFRGSKREAQIELARLISHVSTGDYVDPSKMTIAAYLRSWVETAAIVAISPKTAERYRQLIERQITPHLGALPLQKLGPAKIAEWHGTLLAAGRKDGGALATRTVGHAHRVLHKALADAVARQLLLRNAASLIAPPKVENTEMEILPADQVQKVLAAIADTDAYPHVLLLLSTGMRRGELMGLQWRDVDLDANKVRIERAVEATKEGGLRIKSPKTRHGRRIVSLPGIALDVLRRIRKEQLEMRLRLGLGKLQANHFVFGDVEGAVRHPDWLTYRWKYLVKTKELPAVTLHALRHSHASALIASGQDVVTVSRRLGHASPSITLSVYAHLFDKTDEGAAIAIDAILKPTGNKP